MLLPGLVHANISAAPIQSLGDRVVVKGVVEGQASGMAEYALADTAAVRSTFCEVFPEAAGATVSDFVASVPSMQSTVAQVRKHCVQHRCRGRSGLRNIDTTGLRALENAESVMKADAVEDPAACTLSWDQVRGWGFARFLQSLGLEGSVSALVADGICSLDTLWEAPLATSLSKVRHGSIAWFELCAHL